MKTQHLLRLALLAVPILAGTLAAYGQVSSAAPLSGTITDPSGAVVSGAAIIVKNDATGATFNATTVNNGTFTIPTLNPGTYTVTVTAPGFKQAIVTGVKLDAGAPASVQVSLEVGAATETVTVQGGGDVMQTQTAAISTTIVGRQITELPLPWRDSTNLALLLPGANTPGTVRGTTFLGLPPNAVNIMVDGVNVQEQLFRNNNDFFSFVSARVDAIEEASISTAATSADISGQGAVQIKFVTRSGNNNFHGSLYEYHRNTALNANYWFNNRDLAPVHDETHLPCATYDPKKCHAPRNRILLNQFGGRIGGPIIFPKLFDGRNKAFFFVNVENYSLPVQNSRQRTILNPLTQAGIFRYNSGGAVREVNLLQLAAAKGQLDTIDPIIGKLLADIRATTVGREGNVQQSTDPNLQRFTFLSAAKEHHIYPTMRLDFNLTSKHHLEYIANIQQWRRFKDSVNSADPRFPGFPNFGDTTSTRFSHSAAVRSTLSAALVNEARVGLTGGKLHFFENASRGDFTGPVANQGGFNLGTGTGGIGVAGITPPNFTAAPSTRNSPIWTFADNLTWQRGAHSLAFGTTFTQVTSYENNKTTVPSLTFGVDTSNDPARVLFDAANGPVNFPGATNNDLTNARNIYAVLTGRVTAITGTAWLDEETGKYVYIGDNVRRARQRELGFYAQDSWRWKPNLTLNYGLRWQIQFPFTVLNNKFSTTTLADLFGVSGPGNLFKPGEFQGRETEFVQYKEGDKPYPTNYKNFAPSFGFAWSPNLGRGPLKLLFGEAGQTVLRGGYSISFIQPSIASFTGVFNGNPGGSVNATRNVANGNLVSGAGADAWPLLLRQPERLGPPSFPSAPNYPLKGASFVAITDSAAIFGPDVRIPYVQSWTFGWQREIGKDTAIEIRYVGNFNLQNLTSFNLNERNFQTNGFYEEFKLAQANLQANIAAGRGNTFRYFGPGTGTAPLPIILAHFSGVPSAQAGDQSRYASTNFTSTTFVNPLALQNADPSAFALSLYNDATRRDNALRAGLPANLFLVNPGLQGGASFTGNGGFNRYDSGVVEFRRRMAKGLLLQSSYTFAKGYDSQFISLRKPLERTPRPLIAHTLRANWIYELPFGSGKELFNRAGKLDRVVSGWEFHGVARTQSGGPFSLGNVRLVGMTRKELQDAIKIRFDTTRTPNVVFLLPQDIIDNTIRAFNVSATSASGYSTRGVPTGRYIAPANSATCTELFTGDCGFTDLVVSGRPFTRFDLSVVKKTRLTEKFNFELRAEVLNAFNHINFITTSLTAVGGFASDNFGQVNAAYQDLANTNESGGRMIQIVARFNF